MTHCLPKRAQACLRTALLVAASGLAGACGDDDTTAGPGAGACPEGQSECDGRCVSLQNNPAHCGSCDNACGAGQACVSGTCECGAQQTSCDDECVDLMSDPDHCGGCEEACSATEVCSQGHCSDDCASGEVECNRACVDTEVDPSNCGECGNVCEGGQICTAGSCSCTSDESLCGGACIDTSSDPSNCGSCDHACANGQSCVDGECTGGQTGGSGGTSGAGGSTQTGGTPPTPTPAACSEAFEEDAACSDSTGQTYYVSSSSGSDGNDGLSEEAPLATIGAVNELSLGPGDRVLFKCGDTWDLEQLNVTSSGAECQHIVYSSYPAPCPAGQEPTLSGRRAISGFAQDSGNVWVADLSAGDNAGRFPRGINQLFRDASRLPMGKWPNPGELANGFSYIDTHDGNVIEDDELPSEDWSGAVIRIRTVRWLLLNREVTSSSGSALTLGEYVDCYADDCGDPDPGEFTPQQITLLYVQNGGCLLQ